MYCVVNQPQAPPAVPMHATPQGLVRTLLRCMMRGGLVGLAAMTITQKHKQTKTYRFYRSLSVVRRLAWTTNTQTQRGFPHTATINDAEGG